MAWICDQMSRKTGRFCGTVLSGPQQPCPVCGCRRNHWEPSRQQIAAELMLIQATWTPRQEREHRISRPLPIECPRVRRAVTSRLRRRIA